MTITRMISSVVVVALSAVGLSAQVVAGPVSAVIPFDGTAATITNDSIVAEEVTAGLTLQNTTQATAGADKWSPALLLRGELWDGSESDTLDWYIINRASSVGRDLVFRRQREGGGLTETVAITSVGIRTDFLDTLSGSGGKYSIFGNSFPNAVFKTGSSNTALILQPDGTEGVGIGHNMNVALGPSSGVTAVVMDNTTTTGDTEFVVRAGDGETGNLQEWQDNSKGVLASVSATGQVSGVAGGNIAACPKFTVAATDLTTAGTSHDETLFTLPAQSVITGIIVKTGTSFSGGILSAATVSIGDSSSDTAYTVTEDIFAAVGDTNFLPTNLFKMTTFAARAVFGAFEATGDDWDNVSTGSVDIWVCWVTLP